MTRPYQAEKKEEECFVSSMLDVFEKLQTPDTEMEEDIKAIGMVEFTGEWINASLVDFYMMYSVLITAAAYDTVRRHRSGTQQI